MKKIKFNEPFIAGNELKYIEDVFSQNQFYGVGKYTRNCTEFISNRLNAQDVLLTDSCTSALEIAALLLRDKSRVQEVILPSYTFSSTASAFARAGFNIVFAEIEPESMMLDLNDVENKITNLTEAIVVVHYGGFCADLHGLKDICKKNKLYLVEDAAQAFDSYLDGKALGTFGDFGCFSFHETKNIHAGLSGALLVNNVSFMERATHIWERGTNRQEVLKGLVDKYSWVEIGGSFYPSELQAAFLYAQLEVIDKNIEERKAIYLGYRNGLDVLRNRKLLVYPNFIKNYTSNYHAFFVIFQSEAICDRVRLHLVSNDVGAYIGYVPLHSSVVGKSLGYKEESLPITEEYSKRLLRLPFHNNMTSENVEFVCRLIREYFDV